MARTRAGAGLLIILLAAAAPDAAGAQEIRVRPVARAGRVYVTFSIAEAFTEEVREAIRSGMPMRFSYDVELRRGGSLWFDRTIVSAVLAASVRYDNLTRRYHVSRAQDGSLQQSQVLDSEEAVRVWLTAFDQLPLFNTEGLEPNGEYSLRVRVRSSPRRGFWPWGRHDASGMARFTFIP